uniref:Transmembrane protein n=1 Tax=Caenorhabditis japonica TaxID=281687 RepID=A0A8R1EAF3_CAEJA
MGYHCANPLVFTFFLINLIFYTTTRTNFSLSASLDHPLPSRHVKSSLVRRSFSERTTRTNRTFLARRDHLRLLVTSRRHVMRGAERAQSFGSRPHTLAERPRGPARLRLNQWTAVSCHSIWTNWICYLLLFLASTVFYTLYCKSFEPCLVVGVPPLSF